MPIVSFDPNDPEQSVVDTAPPGTDPDALVSFDPSEAESEETLDPEAYADEPWSDVDPEAAAGDEVSFGTGLTLADVSSYERWLQSALNALLHADLTVDGKPGPRTKAAVERFQKQSCRLGGPTLRADGEAGPKTIAALEQLTGTTAPTRKEGDPAPAKTPTSSTPASSTPTPSTPTSSTQVSSTPTTPPSKHGTLSVREGKNDKGVTEYVITGDGMSTPVRFSYWTPAYRNYKPYNVSSYKGALRGLLKDEDFYAVGYSPSELKILRANSLKESGGTFGAINTWDNQAVSWGMAQFAGVAGTLAALLADLKDNPRTTAAFNKWFAANGIDVARGKYPWKNGETKTGWHVVVARDGQDPARGNPGWEHIRTQPGMIGAFLLAGNDPALQLGQCAFWLDGFVRRTLNKRIGQRDKGDAGKPVRDFITSERGSAILVRLHNWMPAYVVSWSNRFIKELQDEHRTKDVYDPGEWDQALEDAFLAKVRAERIKLKTGSYDDYALDCSKDRGSFRGPAAS